MDAMFLEVVDNLREKVKMTKPCDSRISCGSGRICSPSANTDRSPHAYKATYALLP
jgi:hypothetical protein